MKYRHRGMLVSVLSIGNYNEWVDINNFINSEIGIADPKVQTRAYISAEAAIIDQLITFAQFFSHKRTMYFHRGVSPFFENIIPHLLRDTFKVQNFSLSEELATAEKQQEFVKNLSPDTACVVVCANHAGTGESFELDAFIRALDDKRVHVFIINHGDRDLMKKSPASFFSYMHTLGLQHFNVLGSRWKNPTLTSWQGYWNLADFKKGWQKAFHQTQDVSLVENFENQFSKNKFFKGQNRIPDRATLVFSNLNAELIIFELAQRLQLSAPEKKDFSLSLMAVMAFCSHQCPPGGDRLHKKKTCEVLYKFLPRL